LIAPLELIASSTSSVVCAAERSISRLRRSDRYADFAAGDACAAASSQARAPLDVVAEAEGKLPGADRVRIAVQPRAEPLVAERDAEGVKCKLPDRLAGDAGPQRRLVAAGDGQRVETESFPRLSVVYWRAVSRADSSVIATCSDLSASVRW